MLICKSESWCFGSRKSAALHTYNKLHDRCKFTEQLWWDVSMASHLYISAHSPINLRILQFIYIEKKVASSSMFRRVSSPNGLSPRSDFLKEWRWAENGQMSTLALWRREGYCCDWKLNVIDGEVIVCVKD